jgi:UTP--glucose-1-phosphate uridylyltransferase
MSLVKIRKAVIAVAGMGTRFLPQTKAMPKEMLPIIDKPIIQCVVEELVDAGIEDIVLVTGTHKRSIEDHFDSPSSDLVKMLSKDSSKKHLLDEVENISNLANFIYIRQKGAQGTATPLINAENIIGNEPFIYTYGDDFIKAKPGRFKQMVEAYNQNNTSILSLIRVQDDSDYDKYGFVDGSEEKNGLLRISSITEKPGKSKAPSSLASVSSYLFTPSIFSYLNEVKNNYNNKTEFYLQYAIQLMIDRGEDVLGYEVKNAKYYDTGSKLEYLKTVIDFGLAHPVLGKDLKAYIKKVIDK